MMPENQKVATPHWSYGKFAQASNKRIYQIFKYLSLFVGLSGCLILLVWCTFKYGTVTYQILTLGLGVIVLAFLMYFITPKKFIDVNISDAISTCGTLLFVDMLHLLSIRSAGIYTRDIDPGKIKVFIPLSSNIFADNIPRLRAEKLATVENPETGFAGIIFDPPGYDLFIYAKSLGAFSTSVGFMPEMTDLIIYGFNMASNVKIAQEPDRISVTLFNPTNIHMCHKLRDNGSTICQQFGCPICSLIGCMVVDSTKRKAMIGRTTVTDNSIQISYELF